SLLALRAFRPRTGGQPCAESSVTSATIGTRRTWCSEGSRSSSIGATTPGAWPLATATDRKSTRLNSSHVSISYAVLCLKKRRHFVRQDWERTAVEYYGWQHHHRKTPSE